MFFFISVVVAVTWMRESDCWPCGGEMHSARIRALFRKHRIFLSV